MRPLPVRHKYPQQYDCAPADKWKSPSDPRGNVLANREPTVCLTHHASSSRIAFSLARRVGIDLNVGAAILLAALRSCIAVDWLVRPVASGPETCRGESVFLHEIGFYFVGTGV